MLPLSIFSMLIACSDKPTPNNDESPPQTTEQKSKEVAKPPTFIQTAAEECNYGANTSAELYSDGVYKVSGDLVNVRSEPSTQGSVVQQIPLGSQVTVGECFKKETLNNTKGCWYPLLAVDTEGEQKSFDSDSAYLFSTAFGDCFVQADLDSDGVDEDVFLIFRNKQLRIHDPNATVAMTWFELPTFSSAKMTIFSNVRLELIQFEKVDEYNDRGTDYYSYRSKPKPTIKKSLSISNGIDDMTGQNTYQSVSFNEDGTATVTTSYSVMDEEFEEQKPSETVQYCLRNGVFTQCSTPSNEEKDGTQSSAQ